MLYNAILYYAILYYPYYALQCEAIQYYDLWYVMLVLMEPYTGYDAGLPCDRVPQCDFWDSTGYTFQVDEERQQG